jgi:hypothetical protein
MNPFETVIQKYREPSPGVCKAGPPPENQGNGCVCWTGLKFIVQVLKVFMETKHIKGSSGVPAPQTEQFIISELKAVPGLYEF